MAKRRAKRRYTRAKKVYRRATAKRGGFLKNVISGAIVGAGVNVLSAYGGAIPVIGGSIKQYAPVIVPLGYAYWKKDPFWAKIGGYAAGQMAAGMVTGTSGGPVFQSQVN